MMRSLKTLITLLLIFIASMAFSQTADDYIEILRDVLKTEKKAAIADYHIATEIPIIEIK
ncbi:MAG: hypothetical protein C0598_13495 [Marinilabiliales bacterium]|nr:MAG: hypothetical protein C0598_13495 [Marinilabiliales bacterium]